MKVDKYTKSMLTIIAGCLILLVLKTYNIVPNAYAASPTPVSIESCSPSAFNYVEPIEVEIESCSSTAFNRAEPIEVKVVN